MFNKKRIFIFVIFLLCLFFLMTFAGGSRDEGIVTRLVEFYDSFDDSLISSTNVEVGKDAEVPEDPKHENYVFAGWYLYDNHDVKVTKFTNIREDLKVIALYAGDLNNNGIADDDEEKLTVTFYDTLGNRVLKEEEVLPGLDATAPEVPVYTGYAFGGWSRGYTNVIEDITVNTIYNNIVGPTINISEDNLGSMLVYEEVPTFTATATDRDGNPVEVVITTNIDGNTAGSYTVTYTATDNDGNTTTITRDFVVERRNLEVTIDDKTSVYGEPLEELTYEITNGEVIEEYLPGITLTKANGTNVGVYAITGTYTNRNYNITFINGIYTITKANYDVNVEFPQEDELVYDGEEQEPIVIEELPETVIPEITYKDEEGNPVDKPVDAGDYDVEITFTCTDDNYNCPENIEGTITINKAPLTVITGNATKVYDGTALTAEGTLTGLVNGETATLNITGTQTNVGTSDNTYTITWGTAKETNYEVKETIGTLTVTQKDITDLTEEEIKDLLGVTYEDLTVVYDGSAHEVVITSELPAGIEVSYTGNKGIDAGKYDGVATLTGSGNYIGTTTLTATLTINKATYDLSGITFVDKTVEYDGKEHKIEITGTLPEGVTVKYTNNTGVDAGEYKATATFKGNENYNEIASMNATLTITAKSIEDLTEEEIEELLGVTYNDLTVIYDGSEHEVVITDELPAGIEVSYTGNKGIDAGKYDGVATLTGSGNYIGTTTLTATLTINKATYDLSGITFVDKTVEYDGKEHKIEITGTLPEGVTVKYTNNTGVDAGEYKATATFKGNENYNEIASMNATLTITAKSIEDLTEEEIEELLGVTYNDLTVIYDGSEHEVVITDELPAGIEVSYTGNKGIDAGKYDGVATLTGSGNYIGTTTLTATLTINKATYDLSGITFVDKTVEYDGKEHKIEITGTLPEGVTVKYTNNTGVDAGEYKATATFKGNENYNEIASMNATLTITAKSIEDLTEEEIEELLGVTYNDLTVIYDGSEHEVVITDELPAGIEVSYTGNKGTDAGKYDGVATLTGSGNYIGTTTLTATLTINKATYDLSGITFVDKTVEYDGKEHKIEITGTLPEGVTVKYTNNTGVDAGEYKATATFKGNENYNEIASMNATLTITAKSIEDLTEEEIEELLGVTYNDLTVIYDGSEHEVVITDELPAGIEVSYTGNKGIDAGKYDGVATLTGSGNYIGTTTLTATLTINKATYDLSGITFVDKTVEYDGKEHKVEITGTLPEGVTVKYTNNTGVDAGEYKATATFKGNENYNEIASMNATLTITAKEITEEDIAGYVFDGKEETYNGEIHSLELTGLDTSKFSVSYEGNNQINAEEYTVTAIITGIGNYTGTIKKTATLKINKADISFVADSKTSEKGTDLVELTYTTTGTIYGKDNLNINISTDANKDVAGTYDIIITASNPNYNISLKNAKYKVFNDENGNNIDDDEEAHYTVKFVASENGQLEGTLEYTNILTGLTLKQAGINIPTVVPNQYYEFKNWTPSIPTNETVVNGDLTFTAEFGPINDENNNGIADEEESYKVTFVDYDGTVLSEQTVLYGTSATAPKNPTRKDWTFTGWDKDFTNITSELVITAQYTPNQIGIRVEEKPNVMFQFQKDSTPDFTKLINVYEVYADGSEKETLTYTTDVDTSKVVSKKTLTITENGFTNTDIKYSVINEEAYQSKFEIDFTGENFYYKTENSFWGGSCTTNCDSPENTTKETTTYNFIEIVEHYDENIEISDVFVTYTNGNSEYIRVSDMVRWTHVNGGSYYNPVYIGTTNRTTGNWWNKETDDIMNDTYIIDTVAITYDRTGYGRYTVYFKYDASTKTFTPYDEIKIS